MIHCQLRVGGGVIFLCDNPPGMPIAQGNRVHVCLNFDDIADMRARFDALAVGGKVTMPLDQMFWGATFGMLTDAFGIHWMFNCMTTPAQ